MSALCTTFVGPFLALRAPRHIPMRQVNWSCASSPPAGSDETTRPASKPAAKASKPAKPMIPEKVGENSQVGEADLDSANKLSDPIKDSPVLNSTLLNSMRDYFGDDGREVEEYMKRPRSEDGRPLFRVLIAGASDQDMKLAKQLVADEVTMGLYFVAEQNAECTSEMSELACLVAEDVTNDQFADTIVGFAQWAVADAVFVGGCMDADGVRDVERRLAEMGVTVFASDVGAAISEGKMEAFETLRPIGGDEDGANEQLLE